MPKIKVDIQGKQYELSPENLEETFKKYPGMKVVMPEDLPAQPTTLGPTAQYVQGLGRMGAQGVTFGHGDELEAGLDTLTGDEPYEKRVADIREGNAAFRQENPKAAFAAEFVGGVAAPGAALVKGAKYLPKAKIPFTSHSLRPSGALAITGAAEGAVAGAGYSEAEPGTSDFNRDVGIGAGAGAVLAPVGGYVAQKGGQLLTGGLRAIRNRVAGSDYNTAVKLIREAAARDEITAGEGKRLIKELGREGILADEGPNLLEMGRVAATKQSAGKKYAQDVVMKRQQGSQAGIKADVQELIDPKWDNYHQFLADTKTARKTQAGPLFEEAYEQTIDLNNVSSDFREIMGKPAFKKAVKNAQKEVADTVNHPGTGMQISDNSVGLRLLHEVKRDLWKQRERAIRGSKPDSVHAGNVKDQWAIVRKELNDQSAAYKQANQIYAGGKQLDEAAEMGADLLKGTKHIDDLEGIISEFTEGEHDAFRVGAIKGIFNKVDTADLTHDSVKRLMGSTRVKKLLEPIFEDPEDFTEFMSRMARKGNQTKTFNYTTQGRLSPTAQTQQETLALQKASGVLADFTRSGGSMAHTASKAAEALFSQGDIEPGVLNWIARILFDQDLTIDQINRIIGPAKKGAMRTPTGAGAQAFVGGLLPSTVDTATQLGGSERRRPGNSGALAR